MKHSTKKHSTKQKDSGWQPLRSTFWSPYEQYARRIGQAFTLIGAYLIPSTEHEVEEVGPMFRIRFADGIEIDAWPEEVFEGMMEKSAE